MPPSNERFVSVSISGGFRVPSAAWWLFIAALVVEFFLFDHYGSHRITSLYPRWNDQIQYLSEAYTGYEYGRSHGLAAGLGRTLTNSSAQGTLHDFAAVVLFQFTGPSRSAALALNMLALIAWQLALFLAVARRCRSEALGLAAAMLPLVLRGPWENIPGGAYDFRLDHLAMCALGVASAVALMTDRFRSRAGSLAFGAAVGIALLTRFLTGTYFVVLLGALFVWTIAGAERAQRTINLLLSALVAAALAGPIFWLNREWIWNYYYVGHYIGPESAIRNQNFGLGRSLAFVWGGLAERHVGLFFALFAAGVAIAIALARIMGRRPAKLLKDKATLAPTFGSGDIIIFGGAFLLAPALVLTLHPQKSAIVLSALVPGLVLLIIAIWIGAAQCGNRAVASPERNVTIVGIVAAVVALVSFGYRQTVPADDPGTITNLRQVNTIADYIFTRGEAAKLDPIRVGVDHITDALDAQVLRVICYERHRIWRNFDITLPTGIAEPEAGLVRERVAASDFVFLTADDTTTGQFPFDQKLAALRPELRTWCEAHLHATQRFTISGRAVVLYEKGVRD